MNTWRLILFLAFYVGLPLKQLVFNFHQDAAIEQKMIKIATEEAVYSPCQLNSDISVLTNNN